MSFVNSQFEFLAVRSIARTNAELEIPDTPPDAGECQGYHMNIGDRFIIYSPNRKVEGHFVVERWLEAADRLPRMVELRNVFSAVHLALTGWQVSTLERQGRFRTSSTAGDSSQDVVAPGLKLMLNEKRRKKAEVKLGYVDACLAKYAEKNHGVPTRRLTEEAIREHAAERNEKAPSYSGLWPKVSRFVGGTLGNDPMVVLADKERPGNPGSQFGKLVDDLVDQAVVFCWTKENGTWEDARDEFNRLLKAKQEAGDLPSPLPPKDHPDHIKLPSERTFQRRKSQVNEYDRLRWRYTEEYANRQMAFYIRQALPDLPLDIVDVDHVTMDIVVVDDRYPVAFGRPDLIVFRDRKTGSILGISIGFENPSYESFLNGLRHAMYPKDMSAFPGLAWRQHGRMLRLGVDNALHLVGDNIKHSAAHLRFQLVEYHPGHPWEKGALERLNGIINQRVSHGLPGSTFSNPSERKKHKNADENDDPVLFLSEFEGFVVDYICRIYHTKPQRGLGFLRSLAGVPNDLWDEGIRQVPNRVPVSPDIFVRLAGDVNWCGISDFGIRLDHIIYVDEALLGLTCHPDHKKGAGRHHGTKYKVVRDPNDLGRVWVEDPYRKVMIEVAACAEHYSYANGLRLFQHKKIVEYHRTKRGKVTDASQLQKCMEDYTSGMTEFIQRRKKHGIARKFAAFVAGHQRKLARTQKVEAVTSAAASSERMDIANPLKPARAHARSTRASLTEVHGGTGAVATVTVFETPEDSLAFRRDPVAATAASPAERSETTPDIEFLKSKYKGYD